MSKQVKTAFNTVCLNDLLAELLLNRWTKTDECFQGYSLRPEDVHEGG